MTVAYMRGNRGISRAKADAIIGESNLFEAIKQFADSVEADAGPPEVSETELAPPDSGESTESPNGRSGASSIGASGERDEIPAPTGTSVSGTSPTPDPMPLASGNQLT